MREPRGEFGNLPPGVKPEDCQPDAWEPSPTERGRREADRKEL